MICNNCKSEMKRMTKFWFCDECGNTSQIRENAFDINDWKYKEDGTMVEWVDIDKLKAMPYVIAHEYDRIRILIEEKQPYGAVMQLKDAYECIVKFLVLKECSRIHIKENKTDREIIILKTLTEKLLLLSNWKNLMIDISELEDVDENTRKIMKDLNDLLQGDLKVIEWRNRIIGHGALGYADNPRIKQEFLQILDGLTKHIEEYKEEYFKISFGMLCTSNNDFQKLSGLNLNVDGSKYEIDSLIINNLDNGRMIKLYPFIIFHNNDIYFFDSFSSGKKCTDIISYTLGVKEEIRKSSCIWNVCKTVVNLHNKYQDEFNKRNLVISVTNQITSVDDGVFFSEAEKNLLENYTVRDSIKTMYLQKWLQEKIKEDKGIFLLQAQAETGKTIASMQLEGRINNRIDLSNTTVKVIYINETNNKLGYILDNIELAFTTGLNGENIIRQREKSTIAVVKDVNERKKELANYLNSMKNKLECIGKCKSKLLVVFDGLDELSDEDLDFCEYLPNEELLNSGIYILVTSRTDNEISGRKKKKLHEIDFSDSLEKIQDDKDIAKMHEEYITNKLSDIQKSEKDMILNIGEKSFLQIYLAVFMISNEMIKIDELDKFDDTNKLIEKYLKYLNDIYGNKSEMIFYKIIYLLASDMRARTLEDISYQIGEEKLSFTLLGIIQDLRAIFEINHHVVNMFRVNHENKKTAIFNFLMNIKKLNDVKQEVLNTWKGKIEDISFWDEEELIAYKDDEYDNALDSMMELPPKSFYFLDMFFKHPLAIDVEEWKDILTPKSHIAILEKLFAGPNSYLRSKEWAHASKFLAEEMSSYMDKQCEETQNEKLKPVILFTNCFCQAFSFWRKWYSKLLSNDKTEDFLNEKSKMHECYDIVWKAYEETKNSIGRKYNQSGYNFLVFLEVAVLNMVEEFIEFYEEIDAVELEEKWRKMKTTINNNSVKRYDIKMNKYVDFVEFYDYHKSIRMYYSNNKDELIKENLRKVNDIKEKLLEYDLTEFDKLSIQREDLHSKLVLMSYRKIKFYQREEFIEESNKKDINEVIYISQKIVSVVKKQIEILRSENDEGKRDDEVSECIRKIADTINEFVGVGMVITKDHENALKMARFANQLYELLSDKMQKYYILQRVTVVTNYVMLLNVTNNINERNCYLEWYIKNREHILSLVNEGMGKISEQVENNMCLMDLVVKKYKNNLVDEIRNKAINKNYFEINRNDGDILRVMCKKNHFSRTPKVVGEDGDIRVKFKKEFCNTCEMVECPAFKGIHEVILENNY